MTVGIIGLGYVGLPLAVAFGAVGKAIGYDRDERKVARLRERQDVTGEVSAAEFTGAKHLQCTADPAALREADFLIIAVPTPVDAARRPDLSLLLGACETAGRHMKRGATVVVESTVYPGCTEEDCVPVLERASGMRWKEGFSVGYSPERINPGDREHRLASITKVVSGDTPETLERVAKLYGRVALAGVHRAPSIRVAEAAKVIENTQRDVNIALVNEFALIFHRLGIDTTEVLEAAKTKWNFLPFSPGLVGGHCIGVDPYYLIQKAQAHGYYPDILLACRRINDAMGQHVAAEVVKLMVQRGITVAGARILLLGITFKENCPDLRNTRVVELAQELEDYRATVDIHDPWADRLEALQEYGVRLVEEPQPAAYDAVVIAVAHDEFRALGIDGLRRFGHAQTVYYDIKGVFPKEAVDARL